MSDSASSWAVTTAGSSGTDAASASSAASAGSLISAGVAPLSAPLSVTSPSSARFASSGGASTSVTGGYASPTAQPHSPHTVTPARRMAVQRSQPSPGL